jgi:hypothetical protein
MTAPSRFPHDEDSAPEKMRGWEDVTERLLGVLVILALGLTLFIAIQLW